MSESLQRLAAAHGIAPEYHDIWGHVHRVEDDTLRALLGAMRVDAGTEDSIAAELLDLARARCRQCVPPMTVVRSDARPWRVAVHLAATVASRPLAWRVRSESGIEPRDVVAAPPPHRPDAVDVGGERFVAFALDIDVELPEGYHGVELLSAGQPVARGTLAVAPPTCYRPASLRGGGRRWGAAVQLYGLRSNRNWGIGDFTDLATFVEQWGAEGADVIGVNPLHALFPHNPAQASPYSPSSRMFVNVLYLDVEAIPEFERCAEARERVESREFQAMVAALRSSPLVDYEGVAAAKLQALELVYGQARREARAGAQSRWTAFDAFKTAGGDALRRHALFDALQAHFFERDPAVWGWPSWPGSHHDPQAPAITLFADQHADRVDFFAWLQWQAQLQRASAAEHARRCGLTVGLYSDLAVSIDRGGADAWAQQELYAISASVGAPPDAFNVKGQDWGLPPLIPQRLQDAGYAPFIATLRANMRDAGALRIDHVMGLLRLYWVPSGASAAQGAYVRYPFDDLLGLLALESHRHRCLVIGEDLGTVPDEVRRGLAANDVLSYRVLLFERDAAGNFKPPADYPEPALAIASTHDLPTLAGWWEGCDIALRGAHGQLGPDANADALMAERVQDRGLLLAALARAGLLAEGAPLDPGAWPQLTPALADAVQVYLSRTPSALLVLQPEDVFGVREQANLPGTTVEHPNWRRKLPVALEDQKADGRVHRLAVHLAAERASPRTRASG